MSKKTYYRALTIAGSDSGGGAGIQADLKTFSALGCYGMSVITALTAQNTQGVDCIYEVTPAFVTKQLDAVVTDIGVDAVKIGMLHDPEIIKVVAERLNSHEISNIVLDPVMVAQSGDQLIKDTAIEALAEYLIPLADIITPNIPEAETLADIQVEGADDMEKAAQELLKLGSGAVLLKGGHHKEDKSTDCLVKRTGNNHASQTYWFDAKRIDTQNTHGTGCTLSSAIAAYLARNYSMEDSVHHAKNYMTKAIEAGNEYTIGKGQGPVHHFHNLWDQNKQS